MRGAELRVVGGFVQHSAGVEADADMDGGLTRGRFDHLHQAHRMSAGDGARIEGAFLPRDGVDDRTRRRPRKAREARHAKGGEGEIVEREAAMRGELAEGERSPGVADLRDHIAQRGDLRFVDVEKGSGPQIAFSMTFSRSPRCPELPQEAMSSSQPFQPSSPISVEGALVRRKSRFTYKQLSQLALASTTCPLRVIVRSNFLPDQAMLNPTLGTCGS